ncbi:hypothetical protein P3T76_010324 [Phytophthora citrophthora]|uniref:Uncharacterized protein n=1 Tax=Phytophthora citrophthora TaxID=4793 RepID=A0AAD9GC46_9STRA|nr:hypothetical protein P3T76_010324 [Phytophthora citrophthora]
MGCYNSKPDEIPQAQHQTKLLYRSTWRVDRVNRLYGACRHGNTVVIIQPGRSPIKPYIRVPEGTYALVQYQGRDTDYIKPDGTRTPVWPPWMHFASLFTQVSQLVTKQYIVFDTPVKGCKMSLILRDEAKGEDPVLCVDLCTNWDQTALKSSYELLKMKLYVLWLAMSSTRMCINYVMERYVRDL